MNLISLRDYNDKDLSFIYNSWLKSTLNDCDGSVVRHNFFETHKILYKSIIERSQIAIACDITSPDFIYGYVIFRHISPDVLILHYAYTKEPFRKFGVFRKIIESMTTIGEPIVTTYKNKKSAVIQEKFNFIYKPEYRGLE